MHGKDTSLKIVAYVWLQPESANTEKTSRAINFRAADSDYHVSANDINSGIDIDV